jgi:hypothetical protein
MGKEVDIVVFIGNDRKITSFAAPFGKDLGCQHRALLAMWQRHRVPMLATGAMWHPDPLLHRHLGPF